MASRVVTPEAVLLELPTAGPAIRSMARVFDLVFNLVVIFFVASPLTAAMSLLPGSTFGPAIVGALAGFVYLVGLPVGLEILWRGRSVGKSVFGLKVVGVDGSRETVRQAMLRGFVAIPEVFLSLGVLAMASMIYGSSSQRLGDLAAGTIVIRSKPSKSSTVPIAFHPPHGYEGYVRSLTVATLKDDDFVLIRDFLLRVRDFTDQARWDLAMRLATMVQSKINAPLPPTIHPEVWLICVASAYQYQSGGLLSDAAMGLAPLAPRLSVPSSSGSRRERRARKAAQKV